MNAEQKAAFEKIGVQVEEKGMTASSVDDGHVFFFRVDVLQKLIRQAQEAGQDKVMIFVKDAHSN